MNKFFGLTYWGKRGYGEKMYVPWFGVRDSDPLIEVKPYNDYSEAGIKNLPKIYLGNIGKINNLQADHGGDLSRDFLDCLFIDVYFEYVKEKVLQDEFLMAMTERFKPALLELISNIIETDVLSTTILCVNGFLKNLGSIIKRGENLSEGGFSISIGNDSSPFVRAKFINPKYRKIYNPEWNHPKPVILDIFNYFVKKEKIKIFSLLSHNRKGDTNKSEGIDDYADEKDNPEETYDRKGEFERTYFTAIREKKFSYEEVEEIMSGKKYPISIQKGVYRIGDKENIKNYLLENEGYLESLNDITQFYDYSQPFPKITRKIPFDGENKYEEAADFLSGVFLSVEVLTEKVNDNSDYEKISRSTIYNKLKIPSLLDNYAIWWKGRQLIREEAVEALLRSIIPRKDNRKNWVEEICERNHYAKKNGAVQFIHRLENRRLVDKDFFYANPFSETLYQQLIENLKVSKRRARKND